MTKRSDDYGKKSRRESLLKRNDDLTTGGWIVGLGFIIFIALCIGGVLCVIHSATTQEKAVEEESVVEPRNFTIINNSTIVYHDVAIEMLEYQPPFLSRVKWNIVVVFLLTWMLIKPHMRTWMM